MIVYNYCVSYFFMSVPTIYDLPNDQISIEIAFIGYSNSGKSSVINALTNSKKLAKVSNTPGSTKYINLFEIKPNVRIIDFPGYGFSKTIKVGEKYWYNVLCQYLKRRKNLKGLVLIMDIRHAIKYLDYKIIEQALKLNIKILLLLNKSDKISKCSQKIQCQLIQNKIKEMFCIIPKSMNIEIFSSVKKYGIESLKKVLNNWFSNTTLKV